MVYNRYDIEFQVATTEFIPLSAIFVDYPDINAFLADVEPKLTPQLPSIIEQTFAEKGITVTVVAVIYRTVWLEPFGDFVKLHAIFDIVIDSETDFSQVQLSTNSRVVSLAIPAIFWIIVAIGLAFGFAFVGYGVAKYLENISVEKYKTTKYGWVLDPNTGEYVWMPIITEEGQKPPLLGQIGPLLIFGAFGFLIIYAGTKLVGTIKRKEEE